ncbi:hypothetical protein ES703_74356 [subsurface metagenome]
MGATGAGVGGRVICGAGSTISGVGIIIWGAGSVIAGGGGTDTVISGVGATSTAGATASSSTVKLRVSDCGLRTGP